MGSGSSRSLSLSIFHYTNSTIPIALSQILDPQAPLPLRSTKDLFIRTGGVGGTGGTVVTGSVVGTGAVGSTMA